MKLKRRIQGKTDYKARIILLKGGKARVVFRRTNRYIIGQYIKSKEAKDHVIVGITSKELLKYEWPESRKGSLKSLAASYLCGFLLGKKVIDKNEKEGVADIGLFRGIAKSRVFSFFKGVIDAGVKVKVKEKMFPDEKRIKNNIDRFEQIKQNIEKKFI